MQTDVVRQQCGTCKKITPHYRGSCRWCEETFPDTLSTTQGGIKLQRGQLEYKPEGES